jgi:hypothetical protein
VSRNRKTLGKTLRYQILRRDGFRCQYCGSTPQDGIRLEIDHRTPVSRGGTDDAENLVTACLECNRGKSVTTADEPEPMMYDDLVLSRILGAINYTSQDGVPLSAIMAIKAESLEAFEHELGRLSRLVLATHGAVQ